LHDALARYLTPHVLVTDEVGYLAYGPDAANVLYHVVNGIFRKLRRDRRTPRTRPLQPASA